MRIYLSAPLFTQMERRWNRLLAQGLEELLRCQKGPACSIEQGLLAVREVKSSCDFNHIFLFVVDNQCLWAWG